MRSMVLMRSKCVARNLFSWNFLLEVRVHIKNYKHSLFFNFLWSLGLPSWHPVASEAGLVFSRPKPVFPVQHYDDVIMTMLPSQITSLTVVYSIVYSGVNQRKHQSSASLAFVREIHRGPVNFPHKWPVTRKMFPFDDVIMKWDKLG